MGSQWRVSSKRMIWPDLVVCLMSLLKCLTSISNLTHLQQYSSSSHHQNKIKLSYIFSVFPPTQYLIPPKWYHKYPIIQPKSWRSSQIHLSPLSHTSTPYKGKEKRWDFPGSPVLKTSFSNSGCVGSIPGQGAKISHALWPKNQNIKQKHVVTNSKTFKMVRIKRILKKRLWHVK